MTTLTIVFIVLKLVGVIGWSWWLVVLPTIIDLAIMFTVIVVQAVLINKANKPFKKW